MEGHRNAQRMAEGGGGRGEVITAAMENMADKNETVEDIVIGVCGHPDPVGEPWPPFPTLAHELFHAVRHSARSFGFEQSQHDEAEAYLFERAFEYFAEKLDEDHRAMTGAEQGKGGRK